jgi:hypothetical protein
MAEFFGVAQGQSFPSQPQSVMTLRTTSFIAAFAGTM